MRLAYGDLTDVERRMSAAAATGHLLDLRSKNGTDAPVQGRRWGAQRTVRAALLRKLLLETAPSGSRPIAVRVRGARIVGPLNLGGRRLCCPLELYECYLDDPVDLAKAEAPGISLRGSYLRRRLSARGLRVHHTLNLSRGFRCQGPVRLSGAHIGGQLDLTGGRFDNRDGYAISLETSHIEGSAFWRPTEVNGQLNLGFARATIWVDDSTGRATPTVLRGFRYDALGPGIAHVKPDDRIAWLDRDPTGYSPQPFRQLATVYRAEGHDRAARTVLVASQNRRRRGGRGWRSWPGRAWGRVLWATVAYGYRPGQALLIAIMIYVAGGFIFTYAAHQNLLAPARATRAATQSSRCDPPTYPCVHPWVYSSDVLLPVINLRERENWAPDATREEWVAVYGWVASAIGWILGIAVVAGITNVVRRE